MEIIQSLELLQQNVMVDGIKRFCEINEYSQNGVPLV